MDKINSVIGSIFGCDGAKLADSDTPDTVESWDSVTHIMLLGALEDELGVKFSDAEMAEIHTIGEIRKSVMAQVGA